MLYDLGKVTQPTLGFTFPICIIRRNSASFRVSPRDGYTAVKLYYNTLFLATSLHLILIWGHFCSILSKIEMILSLKFQSLGPYWL